MPYYKVKWMEVHVDEVCAPNEEEAIFALEKERDVESLESFTVDDIEYSGPDEVDYMEVSHRAKEDPTN